MLKLLWRSVFTRQNVAKTHIEVQKGRQTTVMKMGSSGQKDTEAGKHKMSLSCISFLRHL